MPDTSHVRYNDLPLWGAALLAAAHKYERVSAEATVAEAVKLIEDPPHTGLMYGDHQASAPGEAPANWTGALKDSAAVEYSIDGARASIGNDDVPYGPYLEYGTAHMEARSFWGQSVEHGEEAGAEYLTEVTHRVNAKRGRGLPNGIV